MAEGIITKSCEPRYIPRVYHPESARSADPKKR
jgi:hypothetical protein